MAPEIPAADGLSAPAWALAQVPGLEGGETPRLLEALSGGSVNRVYRVDSAAGRFVLRLDGPAWRRPGVDRARELLLHRAAAAGGIAPAIVHAMPEAEGLLVIEYCAGRVWSPADFADPRSLVRLGERLQALHRLPSPEVAAFDPWAIAQAYVQSIESLPGAQSDAARRAAVLARLERCCVALAGIGAGTRSIVHGDLAAANLLQGERLWLLDWEYAQCGHPALDLACIFAYYPAAAAHRRELMAAAGLQAIVPAQLLREAEYVYRSLSWLWHLARGESAPEP